MAIGTVSQVANLRGYGGASALEDHRHVRPMLTALPTSSRRYSRFGNLRYNLSTRHLVCWHGQPCLHSARTNLQRQAEGLPDLVRPL
jgi:hypothetical protein